MRRIAVLDLETDPFEYQRMIYPFVAGFYDGNTFTSYWGKDCIDRSVAMIKSLPEPYLIYAHNGGRFDFFYYLPHIERHLRIVNNRIIQTYLGIHELRDSYAIMPFALEQYKKTPIDYSKFTAQSRDKNRSEILSYLSDDCRDLYDLCVAFHQEFGDNLTIGGTAMKQLRKFHPFQTGNQDYDAKLRKDFYFGGRNQCFETGIIKGPVKVYDVNSMYPKAMQDYLHPVSTGLYRGHRIDSRTCFVKVEGKNEGAFPVRSKDGSLDFTVSSGVFCTSIHEFNAAEETGTFKPQRILQTIGYSRRESFAEFVSYFYSARTKAKEVDDKIHALFYKFVLNSAYGKFAQNPENYADWFITKAGEFPPDWHSCKKSCTDDCRKKWTPSFMCEDYIIWERPLMELNFYNVATGASITGAARAVLLRGIAASPRPLYCDTDSIISIGPTNVPVSETELGAWKLEAEGTMAAICGKKLYAIFKGSECIKKAHKGARLEGSDILKIAKGSTVESCNPVPAFKFDGSWTFTKRAIRRTA
jgi:DNA polymerase type B, organellar and viral